MEVDFRVLSCWVFALKVFLLFMFYRISVFSKNVDYISNQVVYHSIWQEVEIHTYVGNYWKLHLYIYIYLYIYPATAIAVAAPLSRLPQRGLRMLYILQQSASFLGFEKVVFSCFCHSQTLYTSRTRYTDCNAVDCILKFTFGRILWLKSV